VTVSSQYSPELADALKRGRLAAALMRAESNADDLVYRRVITVQSPSSPATTGLLRTMPLNRRRSWAKHFSSRQIRPPAARPDRRLLAAIRPRHQSKARNGQYGSHGLDDRGDSSRRAVADLCEKLSSVVGDSSADSGKRPHGRSSRRLQQGEYVADSQTVSFAGRRPSRAEIRRGR
jgi:hypothetical protein